MSGRDLDGRVAVVTGGAKRIGRAIALGLATRGARVVVNAKSDRAAAEETAAAIREHGSEAVVHLADVADPDAARGLVEAAVGAFGGLDILVNNAALRRATPLAEITPAEWRQVTGIILDGSFFCSQAAAPHLARSGRGRIVNIGGVTGSIGARNRPHVVAAKAAVIGLTKALALELGPQGVTVNCVSPGLIEDPADDPEHMRFRRSTTPPDKIPLQRIGAPDDVARAVVQLCGEEFAYVTGQTIHVNGGVFLW